MTRFVLLSALLLGPALAQAQTWQWASAAAGTGGVDIFATAPDGTGSTVVAGQFSGTITLGVTTLTSAGSKDVFVARLNSAGAWTQAVRAGGPGEDYAIDLALDPSGTATVLGGFYSATAQFGATTLTKVGSSSSTPEIFVAQLTSGGTWSRAVQGGGQGANFPSALAVDAAGNATVTGFFFGPSTRFGNFTLVNSALTVLSSDVFVARLDNAGNWTQAVRIGGPDDERAAGLALDASGAAVVAGSFTSPTVSFGPTTLFNTSSAGASADVFVARLNSTGTWTQAARAGGSSSDFADDVALDAAGNATVVGYFYSPVANFGSVALTNSDPTTNTADLFAARLTAAGTWSQALGAGGPGFDRALSVVVAPNGEATVGGLFFGPAASFGSQTLSNADATGATADLVVARLNSSATAWTRVVRGGGASGSEAALDLALTTDGEATVGGIFQGATTTFGSTTLTATAPGNSALVARTSGLALGTRRAVTAEALRLAPNPAHATTTLTLPTATAVRTILLFDALGRPVRQQRVPAHATATTLDVAGLAPGLYVVRCGAAAGRLVVE